VVQLTCVDLFSGCGGFGLGAELAGYDVIAAVDNEPNLQSAYRLNFPSTRAILADIGELDKSAWSFVLGKGNQRLDLLIGGPPCQGFSRIGLRQKDDPRNSLIGHFFRHVRLLRPRVFVMENVEGLMDAGNSTFLMEALATLPSYYKIVGPIVISAADLGAPTTRKRVIVVGYDRRDVDEIDSNAIHALKSEARVSVRDAIADLPEPIIDCKDKQNYGWARYPELGHSSDYARQRRAFPDRHIGWQHALTQLSLGNVSGLFETLHSSAVKDRFIDTRQGKVEPISRYPKLAWTGQCPTLRAGTGADKGSFQAMRPIHPSQPRVITVREGARLQGFPDWFVFHPAKWHSFRMIGNSVSPIVSEALLKLLSTKSALRVAA
jgi:DNA (cytosine-5)-methyltransferase 1